MALSINDAGAQIAALKAKPAAATENAEAEDQNSEQPAKKAKPVQKQVLTEKPVKKAAKETPAEDDADPLGETDDEGQADDEAGDQDAEDADPALDDAEQSDEDQADGEDGEEQDDSDDELDATFTVSVNGEKSDVSLRELIAGYQRNADYTRKTTALAKERKEIDALKKEVADLPQVREKYSKNGERFAQNAGLVLAALQTRFMPQPPTAELLNTDPAAYVHAKELHQEAMQFMGGLAQEMRNMQAAAEAERVDNLRKGRIKLYEVLPEMKDTGHRAKLTDYARSLGFTDDAIANEPNPAIFQLAFKAMKYDEIMRRKAEVIPNKDRPKIIKQSKAPDSKKAIVERKNAQVFEKHSKTGTIDSGAAAIAALKNKAK